MCGTGAPTPTAIWATATMRTATPPSRPVTAPPRP